MKTPRIVNAVGNIDDDLVSGAVKSGRKKNHWVKWGTFAACFAVLVIVGIAVLPSLLGGDVVNPKETDKRYKNFDISTNEVAIIWPWEYLTESERYYETELNGVKYEKTSGYTVSEELIGDEIGTYNIVGYDENTEEHPTVSCSIYQLKNINQTQFIAVKIADNYYVFKNAVYNPPLTLGELFERVDLSQFLKLERFSENGDGPDSKHFILKDDAYIWNILSGCKKAEFIDQDKEYWQLHDRDFISFSVSSEALGIYKHDISITEDGYLWTNVFNWGYLYYIGTESAEKIIKYAKDNSTKTEYEPYSNNNSICGKIVEITNNYILVDDSILCKDEADGITYKILVNDIQIARYIDNNVISVGDTVRVSYEGEIDEQNYNTISDAFSISDVNIFYEDEITEQNYNGVSGTVSSEVASIFE